jgi:hypothetical protein
MSCFQGSKQQNLANCMHGVAGGVGGAAQDAAVGRPGGPKQHVCIARETLCTQSNVVHVATIFS